MESVLHRVNDVDSHEQIPFSRWPEIFGDTVEDVRFIMDTCPLPSLNAPADDRLPITEDNVWTVKGGAAPGAVDMNRRIAVMDQMGIARQLIFPTFGLLAMWLIRNSPRKEFERVWHTSLPDGFDMPGVGKRLVRAHNDWTIRMAATHSTGRMRPVAMLATDNLEEMMRELERLLDAGVRGFWIPTSEPPASGSPADSRLDPFWKVVEAHDAQIYLHIGGDNGFIPKQELWGDIPGFRSTEPDPESLEIRFLDPYYGATLHYAAENFLTALIVGGVLERFPGLRFGIIETGAGWIGPLADRLDLWSGFFSHKAAKTMSMKPSAYINRNVRATPWFFEPVDEYFRRYPHLSDVYCFSSDYPHAEGGKFTMKRFYERLLPLGDEVVEHFFVKNGAWLLPALDNVQRGTARPDVKPSG